VIASTFTITYAFTVAKTYAFNDKSTAV